SPETWAARPRGPRPARAADATPPCVRPARPRWRRVPRGRPLDPAHAQTAPTEGGAVLFHHRFQHFHAGSDGEFQQLGAGIDQQIDEREMTRGRDGLDLVRGNDCARLSLHGGPTLRGFRPRFGRQSYSTTSEEPPLSTFNSYRDIPWQDIMVLDEKAKKLMRGHSHRSTLTLFLLFMLTASRVWAQGPPFQTDDPTPVDFQHYEFYVFGTLSSTPLETDPVGPAFEFNWGAVPNVQIHAVLPFGAILPSKGLGHTEPNAYGLSDMELGVKYGFIKQTNRRPQFGTFPMLELPTGSYDKGLSVGKVWCKLPLWVEKDLGSWT